MNKFDYGKISVFEISLKRKKLQTFFHFPELISIIHIFSRFGKFSALHRIQDYLRTLQGLPCGILKKNLYYSPGFPSVLSIFIL